MTVLLKHISRYPKIQQIFQATEFGHVMNSTISTTINTHFASRDYHYNFKRVILVSLHVDSGVESNGIT